MSPKIKKYLPLIIGGLLAIPLAFGAFFLTQGALTRAGSTAPVSVKVTDITSSSALITWITDKESQGVVEYGTSPKSLVYFAPEATPKAQHIVELTLLPVATPHYFVIRIGDTVYDNEGVPWTFTTKAASTVQETPSQVPSQPGVTNAVVSPTSGSTGGKCPETTVCTDIQKLFGKGCTTSDYIKCLKKGQGNQQVSPTGSQTGGPTSPSPTFIPAQTLSPTP